MERKEKKLISGTETILDTMGILTLSSFQYKDQLYHIHADKERTYISKIRGDRLQVVDTLFNERLWSYEPVNHNYKDLQIYSYQNRETSGFISIRNDSLSIVSFGKRPDTSE